LRPPIPVIEYDENLPDCFIFDIDNSLAIKGDRSPYDWEKVGLDTPNVPLVKTNQLLAKQVEDIFIFSGRDSVCRDKTLTWLNDNGIIFKELYMRQQGDNRGDSIIKEELYREYI
jgi:hypothetical protein